MVFKNWNLNKNQNNICNNWSGLGEPTCRPPVQCSVWCGRDHRNLDLASRELYLLVIYVYKVVLWPQQTPFLHFLLQAKGKGCRTKILILLPNSLLLEPMLLIFLPWGILGVWSWLMMVFDSGWLPFLISWFRMSSWLLCDCVVRWSSTCLEWFWC